MSPRRQPVQAHLDETFDGNVATFSAMSPNMDGPYLVMGFGDGHSVTFERAELLVAATATAAIRLRPACRLVWAGHSDGADAIPGIRGKRFMLNTRRDLFEMRDRGRSRSGGGIRTGATPSVEQGVSALQVRLYPWAPTS